MSYQEKMPPELRQAIRARLFDVLMQRAKSAAPLPALPEGELLSDMLSIAAGEPLGDEYRRMMSEELAPPPQELPLFEATAAGLDASSDFRVLIIGAGMSGLCAAVRLRQAGVNFSIIEKNATVGGTWLENSYPGCGVDTPNHFYSYSFAPYHDWSMLFAKRRELWDYFERVADEYGIRERIIFDTEVESAVFDESKKLWQVVTKGADGSRLSVDANVVISCVGVLNRRRFPRFRPREVQGAQVSYGAVGCRLRLARQEGGDGRHRRFRSSSGSDDRTGCRTPHHFSALAALDRAQPQLLRACARRREVLLAHLPYYSRWYRFQLFWVFPTACIRH